MSVEQLRILDQIRADEVKLADELVASTVQTRGEADVKIRPKAAKLREQVYRTVERYGPITDERIAELTGMNPNTARPRRLELERSGRLVAAGVSKTRSGRKAVAWQIATDGPHGSF